MQFIEKQISATEKTRYSDAELRIFKEVILHKKAIAREELDAFERLVWRQ